jgi:hypothetical protein
MTSFPAEEPAQVQGLGEGRFDGCKAAQNAQESDRVILGIQLPGLR